MLWFINPLNIMEPGCVPITNRPKDTVLTLSLLVPSWTIPGTMWACLRAKNKAFTNVPMLKGACVKCPLCGLFVDCQGMKEETSLNHVAWLVCPKEFMLPNLSLLLVLGLKLVFHIVSFSGANLYTLHTHIYIYISKCNI